MSLQTPASDAQQRFEISFEQAGYIYHTEGLSKPPETYNQNEVFIVGRERVLELLGIEEYDGFVILATNLILNIDEAFKRRMNYTVEFPLPDEQLREPLWRGMFPPQTPLGDDLDFAFLGRQFSMSGGNIKNAALAAAFLAASEGSAVIMRHLIQSIAREWQKLGKLPSVADFKQYYAWALPQTSNTVNSSADALESETS